MANPIGYYLAKLSLEAEQEIMSLMISELVEIEKGLQNQSFSCQKSLSERTNNEIQKLSVESKRRFLRWLDQWIENLEFQARTRMVVTTT
jgi:transcriptional regulatory protein LevR